jgi:hypothetical protein
VVPLAEGVAPEELPEELPEVLPELLEPPVLLAAPELLEPVVETTRVPAPLELLEEPLVGLLPAAVTWMEKAGSALVLVPSLAAMTILGYGPASGALGVPESSPVVTVKLAQTGLFWMLKLRGVPVGLATVGTKL